LSVKVLSMYHAIVGTKLVWGMVRSATFMKWRI
jgi:hypothetical protein